MHDKLLILVRTLMVLLSLTATFLFLVGMGNGAGAILFAAGGVLAQIAALLWLPGIAMRSWYEGQLLAASMAGIALGTVLLISVAGSVSILSGLVDDQQTESHRVTLEALLLSKQESANKLIGMGHVTKAQPILEEVQQLQSELSNLPAQSGFYLAAKRVGGEHAGTVVTVIIVAIAVLLDGVTLLLGLDNTRQPVFVRQEREVNATVYEQTVTPAQPQPQHQPKQEQQLLPPAYAAEFVTVVNALQQGDIRSASVRNVRTLLKCSQEKATEIARICREANSQLDMIS